jgi:nicotinamidase-related amidase
MLTTENTVLVVVDVQEKLARAMCQKERFMDTLQKLIRGINILGIPIIFTEQYPKGLGPTLPEIASVTPDFKAIPKIRFSCAGDKQFLQELQKLNRKQVLLAGIESHVCVYQTAADLLELGYEVQVVTDAISSRTIENINIGLEKMRSMGASMTSTETALFELLKIAEGEKFKEIQKIIK